MRLGTEVRWAEAVRSYPVRVWVRVRVRARARVGARVRVAEGEGEGEGKAPRSILPQRLQYW